MFFKCIYTASIAYHRQKGCTSVGEKIDFNVTFLRVPHTQSDHFPKLMVDRDRTNIVNDMVL